MRFNQWNINSLQIAALLFLLFTVLSCDTIWEDRSKCPCYVKLNFSDCINKADLLQIWYYNSKDSLVRKDTVNLNASLQYEVALPRDAIRYYVWGGIDMMEVIDGKGLIMQIKGKDYGCMYRYNGLMDTDCEETGDTVKLKKEFSRINVLFKNVPEGFEDELFARLECGTSGYFVDALPMNHDTYIEHGKINYKPLEFIVGRQWNMEPVALMLLRNNKNGEREVIGKIEIGKILKNSGYDMREENLKDMEIVMDYSASTMSITIDDWVVIPPVEIQL